MVNSWLFFIQNILVPGRCIACQATVSGPRDICQPCEQSLFSPEPHCFHCGLFQPNSSDFCGHCLHEGYYFDRCIALAPYQAPMDRLIGEYKYQRQLAVGRTLGDLLAARLKQAYAGDTFPDRLMPVPLHWFRQWRRQFNQAELIARQLSRQLGVPVDSKQLYRQGSQRQLGLSRQQRLRNSRAIYQLRQQANEQHIALVDDVVTTAATANAIARLLKEAGASRVDVWALARTPKTP